MSNNLLSIITAWKQYITSRDTGTDTEASLAISRINLIIEKQLNQQAQEQGLTNDLLRFNSRPAIVNNKQLSNIYNNLKHIGFVLQDINISLAGTAGFSELKEKKYKEHYNELKKEKILKEVLLNIDYYQSELNSSIDMYYTVLGSNIILDIFKELNFSAADLKDNEDKEYFNERVKDIKNANNSAPQKIKDEINEFEKLYAFFNYLFTKEIYNELNSFSENEINDFFSMRWNIRRVLIDFLKSHQSLQNFFTILDGPSLFINASSNYYLDEVKFLLGKNIKINKKINKTVHQLLIRAIDENRSEIFKLFFQDNPNINPYYKSKKYIKTILYEALSKNKINIAKVIIELYPKIITENYIKTIYIEALSNKMSDISKTIIELSDLWPNLKKRISSPITMLFDVVPVSLYEVKSFIKAGADVNAKNENDDTALILAAGSGATEVVKILIKTGADVNAKNENGDTALILAAEESSFETCYIKTVKVLIKAGADVNAKNKNGDTALILAAEEGSFEAVKVLIKAGADVNAKNITGDTALILASDGGATEVARILINADADINAINKKGNTALMLASEGDSIKVVKVLISAGADVNVKNGNGDTALILAIKRNLSDIVNLIRPLTDQEEKSTAGEEIPGYSFQMQTPDNLTIPFRITIGVTGHRTLTDMDTLRETIQQILNHILKKYQETEMTGVKLCVLSPLAEGADRLVVEEVLKRDEDPVLKVVLPLTISDYLEDFNTEESRDEFKKLMEKARYPLSLRERPLKDDYPPELIDKARNQAYKDIGRFTVDHCDVLIALWDGMSAQGKGGTSEIVEYAKEKKCPLYIIHTQKPSKFIFIKGRAVTKNLFNKINLFNSRVLESNPQFKIVENVFKMLFCKDGIPAVDNIALDVKNAMKDKLMPYYAIVSSIAMHFQNIYLRAGLFAFWMTFVVVAVSATGIIFQWFPLYITAIKAILLSIIIFLIIGADKIRSHKNWLEYRFLAERIRSAFFLAVCGIEILPVHINRRKGKDDTQDSWMPFAFEEIWNHIPGKLKFKTDNYRLLGDYIVKTWIEDQIVYHRKRYEKNIKKSIRFEKSGKLIFFFAICSAVIYFILLLFDSTGQLGYISTFFSDYKPYFKLSGLLLPALAFTIEAIRSHGQYKQLALKSKRTIDELESFKDKFELLTPLKFEKLLRELDQYMLQEVRGWLSMLSFLKLNKAT